MTYEDRKSFLQNSELGTELGLPQTKEAVPHYTGSFAEDIDLNTED
jgi:hypothetical protein